MLHPDPRVPLPGVAERESPRGLWHHPFSRRVRERLQLDPEPRNQAKVASWMHECYSTHKKCHQLFGKDGPGRPVAQWFPDRLIRITRSESSGLA